VVSQAGRWGIKRHTDIRINTRQSACTSTGVSVNQYTS
jgi:hypothetical protein